MYSLVYTNFSMYVLTSLRHGSLTTVNKKLPTSLSSVLSSFWCGSSSLNRVAKFCLTSVSFSEVTDLWSTQKFSEKYIAFWYWSCLLMWGEKTTTLQHISTKSNSYETNVPNVVMPYVCHGLLKIKQAQTGLLVNIVLILMSFHWVILLIDTLPYWENSGW